MILVLVCTLIEIEGFGSTKILVQTRTGNMVIHLHRVAYIPNSHINLISVRELTKDGHVVLFEDNECKIKQGNDFSAIGQYISSTYLLNEVREASFPCLHEWHRRLAHWNYQGIKDIPNIKITRCACTKQCDACMKGKSTALPFPTSTKPERCLDVVVSDVCGAIRPQSIGGFNYYLTLTDIFSD